MHDLINKPPHYTAHPSGIECREVTRVMSAYLSNVLKYVWRGWDDLKGDGTQSLEKALRYLDWWEEAPIYPFVDRGSDHYTMREGLIINKQKYDPIITIAIALLFAEASEKYPQMRAVDCTKVRSMITRRIKELK